MIASGRIFRAFHHLVAGTLDRLESDSWPADRAPDIEPLRQPLVAAIRLIEEQLSEEPAADPAVARQVLYLLAVYADDRVMAARWPGRRAWAERRIESELFGSALGPAEVEARCERMLAVPTPENRQLARLFLYAFGLGLGGGDPLAAERLAGLRRRLLEFARPTRQPAPVGRRRLFRQAYRYTAARGERRLMPDLRGWAVVAALLLALVALISLFAWEGAVEGIGEALAAPRGGSAPAASSAAPPRQAPAPPDTRPEVPAPATDPVREPGEADA